MLDDIVTIYQELTGKTVPETQTAQYKAWGRRAIRELENILGWQFDSTETITVLGCSPDGCNCDIATSELLPAPTKVGQYRAFPYSDKQPYALTDPFTKVHHVYICRMEPMGSHIASANNESVILQEVKDFSPRYFSPKFGKYVKACQQATTCSSLCNKGCTNCAMLLVDADWLTSADLPDELGYLLCDYMDWLSNGGVESRGISSEKVDGHEVSYRTDLGETEPYKTPSDLAIIRQFAGAYGMENRKLIW